MAKAAGSFWVAIGSWIDLHLRCCSRAEAGIQELRRGAGPPQQGGVNLASRRTSSSSCHCLLVTELGRQRKTVEPVATGQGATRSSKEVIHLLGKLEGAAIDKFKGYQGSGKLGAR